jgi:hypothetical protein
VGVPAGGTTGQVLTKLDAADYNTIWQTPSGGSVGAIPDGTEAAPGLAFAADPNTGLYRPGTDQVGITAGGNASLIVENGGVATEGHIDFYKVGAPGAVNYERLRVQWGATGWSTNVVTLLTQQGGTGGSRELAIGTEGPGAFLYLITGGQDRWIVLDTGHLVPGDDNLYDLGQQNGARPRDIYTRGHVTFGRITTPTTPPAASGLRLYCKSDEKLYILNSAGVETDLTATGISQAAGDARYLQLVGGTISGALTAQAGIAVTGGAITGSGSVPTGGTLGQVLQKNSATNYDLVWATPAGGGITLPLTQPLTFSPDNTQDIGTNATTARPRDLFLGRNAAIGGTLGVTGVTTLSSTLSVGGNITFATDNAFDVGALVANRPRDLFLGRDLRVGGTSSLAGNVAIGNAIVSASALVSLSTGSLTGATQNGINLTPTFSSAATSVGRALVTSVATAAASFTMANGYGIHALVPAVGAGSAITTLNGIRVENQGASGVSNAYGIDIAAQSGASTTNIGLRNQGTSRFLDVVAMGSNAPFASAMLYITPNNLLTGVTQYGVASNPTFGTGATTAGVCLDLAFATVSSAFTMADGYGLRVSTPVVNTATVTNLYGVNVANQGRAQVTNAYGVYIAAQSGSPTTNLGLYNLGTTQLDGVVGFGATPTTSVGLSLGYAALSGTSPFGARLQPTFPSTATSSLKVMEFEFRTAAAAFTASLGAALNVATPVIGAGSAVTTMRGILVANQGNAAIANAYGIRISAQSGATTTNVGLWNDGTTTLVDGLTVQGGTVSLPSGSLSTPMLAAGAVTTTGWVSFTGATTASTSYISLTGTVTVDLGTTGGEIVVVLFGTARYTSTSGRAQFGIQLDAGTPVDCARNDAPPSAIYWVSGGSARFTGVSSGTHTITPKFRSTDGVSVQADVGSMLVLGLKR